MSTNHVTLISDICGTPRFTGTPSDPPFQEDPKAVEKALKASEQEMMSGGWGLPP